MDRDHPIVKHVWSHGEIAGVEVKIPGYTPATIEQTLRELAKRGLLARRKVLVKEGWKKTIWVYSVPREVIPEPSPVKVGQEYIGGEPDYAYYLRNFFREAV